MFRTQQAYPIQVVQNAQGQALLHSVDLQLLGAFRVPNYHDAVDKFSFGGTALAYNPANNSLFIVGLGQGIAEVSIPATIVNSSTITSLTTGTVLQGFMKPTLPNPLVGATDGAPIGGLLVHNGQLVGSMYAYYSGAQGQTTSHFVLSTLNWSTAVGSGLFQVGSEPPRMIAGYMSDIPPEWQSLLGGIVVSGLSNPPIIGTSSAGPAAFGFDPAQLGQGVAPAQQYLNYPSGHELGNYKGPTDLEQSGTAANNGIVFVPGTSSVLIFGSTGINFEGYGLSGPEWNDNVRAGTGPHSLNGQYLFQVWAYNANDFIKVKNGQLQPWQVIPYSIWDFNLPNPGQWKVGGAAYDPATQRIFMSVLNADQAVPYTNLPLIYAFKVNTPQTALPSVGALSVRPSVPVLANAPYPGMPEAWGTYPGPINQGDSAVLTAGNVFPGTTGTITQAAFYLDNGDGVFNPATDTLLGTGSPDTVDLNAAQNYTLTIPTASLAPGNYTVFAQATDSNGAVSSPASGTFSITRVPNIGTFTATPNTLKSGTATVLSASNITDPNPGETITQVAFYLDNGNYTLGTEDTLLGYGTLANGAWTLNWTVNVVAKMYTVFAQAKNSLGILSRAAILKLTVQ